jgi:alkanesulfonate monooxygenase SsuD/methylene tetrahydromethanopterin reductase-like flavin-dependent oxidoreductase (luciferase family)
LSTHFSVADTRKAAIAYIRAFLASAGGFRMRAKHQMEQAPEEVRPALLELQRRYDVRDHVIVGGVNDRLVDELGLGDFLGGEWAVCGTPDDVRHNLAEFARLGASCVINSVTGNADPLGTLRRFAEIRS